MSFPRRDKLRPAAVAGSWYSNDPQRLAGELDAYLAHAKVDPLPARTRALVAPHAGLMYSGPVAAHAYQAVRGSAYSAIVLLGPSHFVPFEGLAIWADGAWQTPLGEVPVEAELAQSIRSQSDAFVELAAAHRREHSLEMQLPFVARLFPGVPIVPIVMGHQTRATAVDAGRAISRGVAQHGGDVLLVASSDLSHYEDSATAAVLDAVVLRHVEAMDPSGLMTALERDPRHACGGGPMVAVLHAVRELGATDGRVLRYADSGDVSGDKSSVVGYMAAALW